jgi:hypothetical protein
VRKARAASGRTAGEPLCWLASPSARPSVRAAMAALPPSGAQGRWGPPLVRCCTQGPAQATLLPSPACVFVCARACKSPNPSRALEFMLSVLPARSWRSILAAPQRYPLGLRGRAPRQGQYQPRHQETVPRDKVRAYTCPYSAHRPPTWRGGCAEAPTPTVGVSADRSILLVARPHIQAARRVARCDLAPLPRRMLA